MRTHLCFAVPICAIALVVAATCNRDRDPVARIAQTKLKERVVEARLTGGFPWAPLRAATRGTHEIEPAMAVARHEVLSDAGDETTAARHAVAVAHILSFAPENAVGVLEKLASATHDPAIWNDLAAAHFAAAVDARRPEDLVPALAAVDHALRGNADLPEARFNRALILERLGLRDPAISGWKSYLAVDDSSEWATEARSHLRQIDVVDPQFPELSDAELSHLASRPEEIRALTTVFPQEARLAAERELLSRWGESANRRADDDAERYLLVASEVGAQLARNSGDRMLERTVVLIRQSRGAKRRALADGHIDFGAALKTFRSGRSAEAEPVFRRAAGELEAGGSPFAYTARLFAGYARYEQGDVAASTRELEALLPEVPSDLLTCRATVQWQLAICFGAEGRWGDDIDTAKESVAAFVRAGEKANAALMREHVAQAYDLIGDEQTAWTYRAAALPVLGRTSNRFLQAGVLGFLGHEALFRKTWDEAASFTELELEVGKTARYEPGLADAHLRRALIHHHFADGDPAHDLARARSIIDAIPDAGMRSRLEARRVAVEGLVASTPAVALPLLAAAIEYHSSARGQRMFLPMLFLHRARAERALQQLPAARRDLDAALAEIDVGRDSLKSPEQRAGLFESTEGVVEEAIDLALEQKDIASAFAYAERARARTLLDELLSQAPTASQGIPARTAVVEYAILPSRLVAFVVTGSEIRVASRRIDGEIVRANSAAFVEALSHGADVHALGASVYQDLIAPVREWLDGIETLVIVPDAATSSVPFAAIPLPNGSFLIQQHIIVSAPSAAVFAQARAKRNRTASGRLLMVINNAGDSGVLEALPSANEEGRRIASLYRDVLTLSGQAATRAAFGQLAPHAGVIHFAGHSLSSEYRPEETSIVLSGADGRLNTRDISKIPLHDCSTVVLAACSTARGKVRRFEGTLSVARAFLAAGAPNVIATLWAIDDGEAARFFPRVHEQLARGVAPAEAVRAAQLEDIRDSRPPAIWAAIQAIGN